MQDFLDLNIEAPSPIIASDGIDPRLQLLSHSSRTLLHKCPRKYQLYRLSSEFEEDSDPSTSVTFAFGTAVGVGIQSYLQHGDIDKAIFDAFLAWDVDLLSANPRQGKSFSAVIYAIQQCVHLDLLSEYELVYTNSKPAVELSFQVLLPDGFKYRGFVDAVLRSKLTGDIIVLECKTTSGTTHEATYKNSGQALGYSVVLDKIFPGISSYSVLYLVYETSAQRYKHLVFQKSLLQRALWLQDLLIDGQIISLYETYGQYPQHGESCLDFFRPCQYLSLCHMDTKHLTKPLTSGILAKLEADAATYDYTIDFHELVQSQIEKGEI